MTSQMVLALSKLTSINGRSPLVLVLLATVWFCVASELSALGPYAVPRGVCLIEAQACGAPTGRCHELPSSNLAATPKSRKNDDPPKLVEGKVFKGKFCKDVDIYFSWF